MTSAPVAARRLAAEQRNEERRRRAVERTPAVVLSLLVLLTLVAGVTAAVDLRRLASPAGATRAWVRAALTADCDTYGSLSTLPGGRPGRVDPAQCAVLMAAAPAGGSTAEVAVTGTAVLRDGTATADVVVARPREPVLAGRVVLVRVDGRWRVVRNAFTCALLTCPPAG